MPRNFWENDPIVETAGLGGNFWEADPVVEPATPSPVAVEPEVETYQPRPPMGFFKSVGTLLGSGFSPQEGPMPSSARAPGQVFDDGKIFLPEPNMMPRIGAPGEFEPSPPLHTDYEPGRATTFNEVMRGLSAGLLESLPGGAQDDYMPGPTMPPGQVFEDDKIFLPEPAMMPRIGAPGEFEPMPAMHTDLEGERIPISDAEMAMRGIIRGPAQLAQAIGLASLVPPLGGAGLLPKIGTGALRGAAVGTPSAARDIAEGDPLGAVGSMALPALIGSAIPAVVPAAKAVPRAIKGTPGAVGRAVKHPLQTLTFQPTTEAGRTKALARAIERDFARSLKAEGVPAKVAKENARELFGGAKAATREDLVRRTIPSGREAYPIQAAKSPVTERVGKEWVIRDLGEPGVDMNSVLDRVGDKFINKMATPGIGPRYEAAWKNLARGFESLPDRSRMDMGSVVQMKRNIAPEIAKITAKKGSLTPREEVLKEFDSQLGTHLRDFFKTAAEEPINVGAAMRAVDFPAQAYRTAAEQQANIARIEAMERYLTEMAKYGGLGYGTYRGIRGVGDLLGGD